MEGESIIAEQSEVLTEGEVANIVEGAEPEEAVLPSDEVGFELPDKFKGKSAEDIAKAYMELEKMKGSPSDEETVSEQEDQDEVPEDKEISEEQATYNRYVEEFNKNGKLSDSDYAELAKAGYDKEAVDGEILKYQEQKDFKEYQQEKNLNKVLEPLGGGTEKFKEVAVWANKAKTPEDLKAFNEALEASSPLAQQAMLKGLYTEYDSANADTDVVLHSGSRQTTARKGYATQEEFFSDVGSPEYKNNEAYRKAVEKKMSLSGDLF